MKKKLLKKTSILLICLAFMTAGIYCPVRAEDDPVTESDAVTTEEELQAAVAAAPDNTETVITVSGAISVTMPLVIEEGKNIILKGEDKASLTAQSPASWSVPGVLVVNGELSISDLTLSGGYTYINSVDAGSDSFAVIYVNENGKLTIEDGTVITKGKGRYTKRDGQAYGYAGGIRNDGTVIMNGGKIQDNVAMYYGQGISRDESSMARGAGVYNAGTFTMNGGSIANNICYDNITRMAYSGGGGIYNTGSLSIYGGTFSENKAGMGGAIYNEGYCIIDGADVLINKNSAESTISTAGNSSGGGIYVAAGTVELKEGTLSNNRAHNTASTGMENNSNTIHQGNGGAVHVANTGTKEAPATFIMSGGTIKGNYAYGNTGKEGSYVRCGGGIFIQGGTGTNTYDGTVYQAGVCIITGGTITGNYAYGNGSGVCAGNKTVTYSTGHLGSITDSREVNGPAGLFVGGNAVVKGNVIRGTSNEESIYLSDGCEIGIIKELEDGAELSVTMEDVSEDAILARYEDGVAMSADDAERFSITDGRYFALVEDEGVIKAVKPDLAVVAELTVLEKEVTYTGSSLSPQLEVKLKDGTALKENTDFTVKYSGNLNSGEGSVDVTGINGYTGTLTGTFTVLPKDIASEDITPSETDLTKGVLTYTYTGKAINAPISGLTFKDESRGRNLLRNTDYTITFTDNINAGTAYAVISGKGNYTGQLRFPYTITKAEEEPEAPSEPATAAPEEPETPSEPATAAPEEPETPSEPATAAPEEPETPSEPATAAPEEPETPAEQPAQQTVPSGEVFTDVPETSNIYKSVNWAVDAGIVKGYADGSFRPEDSCTREQFAIMLWRMAGQPASDISSADRFSDIASFSNNTSRKAVAWAVDEGIINGFNDGHFGPQETVTRRQVVVMLWRWAGKPLATEDADFSDVSSAESTYKAIQWGAEAGLVKGYSDGTFRPEDPCQRQHIVIFLYRYTRNILNQQ